MQMDRSEEHTSELQSRIRISYAVFCLNTLPKARELRQPQETAISFTDRFVSEMCIRDRSYTDALMLLDQYDHQSLKKPVGNRPIYKITYEAVSYTHLIDDRPENIEGCRKLGMEGIVFTDYETGKKKLEQMLMAKSKED